MTSCVIFLGDMRASRLLRILLLLQNRGRLTCARLAAELEVSPRTILRDVDALTEAGLPIIVFPGHQGGIELGFNYRLRLFGLAEDEGEALAVILGRPLGPLAALGIEDAAGRARAKLQEALPDAVRRIVETAQQRLRFEAAPPAADERITALAAAIKQRRIVRLQARSASPRTVHPTALLVTTGGWALIDALATAEAIPEAAWGDINISARRFAPVSESTQGAP
jgi:predicted DNA-binding transcriptional regulator YafY